MSRLRYSPFMFAVGLVGVALAGGALSAAIFSPDVVYPKLTTRGLVILTIFQTCVGLLMGIHLHRDRFRGESSE